MAMAESAQNFEVAQLWDAAFAQREMAHAMAAQRQRTARIRHHKLSKIAFSFMLLALGATGGFVGAGFLAKEPPAPIEHVLLSRYAIVPVAQPIVDQAHPPADASSMAAVAASHKQPKAAAVAVVPAPAKQAATVASTKTSPAAGANSAESAQRQGKYYEARPDTGISTVLPPTGLKVINVPLDGVLNLDVDGAVRAFKVGDVLPDGSRLKQASAQSGTFETTARRK